MSEIDVARTRRETDNTKTTPEDLFETALADVREGRIAPDTVLILYAKRNAGSIVEFNVLRCGLTRLEEVGLLQTAVAMSINENTPA